MVAYWFIFMLPVVACLSPRPLAENQRNVVWLFVACIVTAFVGLRHQVGGDWITYLFNFDYASQSLQNALALGDPGYYVMGWLFGKMGGSVYWINLFCAVLLVTGTFRLASVQPRPWLALVVAIPYLVIVVGMGYTRQAAAIGLVMWGLVALRRRKLMGFAISVLLAALFHKTALLMLPIAALAASRKRIWTAMWVGVLFAGGFYFLLQEDVDSLYVNYILDDYAFASEGAGIRLAMSAVAALIFLLFRRRLSQDDAERRLYGWMSVITLACVPLLTISLTAADRLALYLIPLQLVTFSRLPDLARRKSQRQAFYLSVIGYYSLVQFVWLNFANNRSGWLPYQFAPLVGAF